MQNLGEQYPGDRNIDDGTDRTGSHLSGFSSNQGFSMPTLRTTTPPDPLLSTEARASAVNRISENSGSVNLGSAQSMTISVHPPCPRVSSSMASSGARTPETHGLPQSFIEAVGNKHNLSGDGLKMLHGLHQIAICLSVSVDLGTHLDAYALMLSMKESQQNMEKLVAGIPAMKRKIDDLEERLNKAPYQVPKPVKDEFKSDEELQKSYGLHQAIKNESHKRNIEKVFKDIAASVRDNMRRDFLTSVQAGEKGKDLNTFTISCSKKYQHLNSATSIDKNYLYRNAVVRCFIAQKPELLRFKEASSVSRDHSAEQPDMNGFGMDEEEEDGGEDDENEGTSKRARTDDDGSKSTGRVAASKAFWGLIGAHLTKEIKKYKSDKYTSNEWKG
ncbi:hypothetical protein Moror_3237, partial [Moniliophthora roreri MCA 2997]